MKIYTEEQVIKAYKIGHNDGHTGVFDCSIEELSLTPIELPSNEEVVVNACKNPIAHDFMNDRQIGFVKGCKWMKEQILNQNK
jgi:hypothetical protein